jgi:predicted TIM-barrel fold metal-dependent hydrolase
MPELSIVDAHVHLWDPDYLRIAWLDGVEMLNKPYGLAEYRAHTEGFDIAAMVYVQVEAVPAYGLLEARWVADRACEDPRIQAIVAWAPVEYGAHARAYLEALVQTDPRVKGVRRLIQTEADPAFCLQPDFVRGVQLLAHYGLSFDLGINHRQLRAATELVRRCPETSFILDHLAMPDIKAGRLDPWRDQLHALAGLPNVFCKISGVLSGADHEHWTANDLAPYIAHAIEVFGENRIVFGGDWPVVLLASSYRRWVETLDALTAQLTPIARRKLWAENARRFYRLAAS